MLKNKFSGIIPPLITPVDIKGMVCEESVKNLIEFVRPFSTALMPTLSSGEGWALSDKQFEDMIKYTVKYAGGLPVLAGVEYKTTKKVIEKALIAKKIGVDVIVVTTPFKKNITQEEIFKHFKDIKEKVDLPIFIYNEKAISGNDISFNTIKKICKLGNVAGIKEASGSPEFTKKLLVLKVPVFQGWEHLCCEVGGVVGYIIPLSNIEPKACFEALKKSTKNNQKNINNLCKKYNIEGDDWYVWLKKALHKKGVIKTSNVIIPTK